MSKEQGIKQKLNNIYDKNKPMIEERDIWDMFPYDNILNGIIFDEILGDEAYFDTDEIEERNKLVQRIKIIQMGLQRTVVQTVSIEHGYIKYSKYQLMDNDYLSNLDDLGVVYK